MRIFAIVVTLAMCGAVVEAQQPGKVAIIGVLYPGSTASDTNSAQWLRELRALGYVDGKNFTIESRYADNKLDRLPALVDELVRLKVDVLVVNGPPAALAAKNATRTIPIVLNSVADPVVLGLVDSLARPGGNITGFTIITNVLAGKRLELLKDTVPKLSRVAVLWNPQNPGNAQQWKDSQLPARALGLQLYSMKVRSAEKFESAIKAGATARSGALAVAQDPVFSANLKLIADLSIKNRLPAICTQRQFVESGGLMSYGADGSEQYRRVAYYIDRILKGVKSAELPVEQPTKFELAINFKTAKTLGLTIPPNVITRADKVVK